MSGASSVDALGPGPCCGCEASTAPPPPARLRGASTKRQLQAGWQLRGVCLVLKTHGQLQEAADAKQAYRLMPVSCA